MRIALFVMLCLIWVVLGPLCVIGGITFTALPILTLGYILGGFGVLSQSAADWANWLFWRAMAIMAAVMVIGWPLGYIQSCLARYLGLSQEAEQSPFPS